MFNIHNMRSTYTFMHALNVHIFVSPAYIFAVYCRRLLPGIVVVRKKQNPLNFRVV